MRVYPDFYLRVFENITLHNKEKAVIIACTVCLSVFSYFVFGLGNSVLLLAFFGAVLSLIRLFWSWERGERFVDIALLLAFFTIFLRFLYEIPYLPTIMTFSAVIRIIATREHLKENRGKVDFRAAISEISFTIAMIFMALIVIAIYMEKEVVILPFLIVGMGSFVFSLFVKRL